MPGPGPKLPRPLQTTLGMELAAAALVANIHDLGQPDR
jgi:hypothetical protein